jgi:hypothetical protein
MLITMISGLLYVVGYTSTNDHSMINIILQFTGVNNGGGQISNTELYKEIAWAVAIIVGAASVTAFLFGNANAGTVVGSSALSLLLLSFISDFWFIIQKSGENTGGNDWVTWVLWCIYVPIIFGFTWSIYDFIKGNE